MADGDRVVFPDEVEDVKAKSAETEATDTNSIEETPKPEVPVELMNRNMITVPSNCPPGQQKGADGVCRDIF